MESDEDISRAKEESSRARRAKAEEIGNLALQTLVIACVYAFVGLAQSMIASRIGGAHREND